MGRQARGPAFSSSFRGEVRGTPVRARGVSTQPGQPGPAPPAAPLSRPHRLRRQFRRPRSPVESRDRLCRQWLQVEEGELLEAQLRDWPPAGALSARLPRPVGEVRRDRRPGAQHQRAGTGWAADVVDAATLVPRCACPRDLQGPSRSVCSPRVWFGKPRAQARTSRESPAARPRAHHRHSSAGGLGQRRPSFARRCRFRTGDEPPPWGRDRLRRRGCSRPSSSVERDRSHPMAAVHTADVPQRHLSS